MENKKLTICFFGTAASIHTLKWANFFSKKGHNVHLISYAPLVYGYNLGNIKLYFLKKKIPIEIWPFNTLLNIPFYLLKVKKIIKEVKPDIINAHYVTSYGHLAALTGFHPLVSTAWGSDILVTPKKFPLCKWSVKYALKKADLITCDGGNTKEAMVSLGVNSQKIRIIYFGVDIKKFGPISQNKNLKKQLNLSNSLITISIRNLEPVYNLETLIKAIPMVIKEIPKAKFIIAGGGKQIKYLMNLANSLKVSTVVKFVGRIQHNELPQYLSLADVYVSTSLSDGGLAMSTAEAMACGLPVVITDFGDNRKWVKDGENGFIIPTKNPKALAEKIIYLLKNKKVRQKFGKFNRQIIEKRNNYYKEMEKMEKIYCGFAT